MITNGIHHRSQITKDLKLKDFFGVDKRISITLYDQILDLPNAEDLAERILLLFSDERGAYKRTYRKRFEEFDKVVLTLIEKNLKGPLLFQDVGISDGRTAADFFEKGAQLFQKIIYTASDYNPKVYVIEKRTVKTTLSQTGKVLEIVWPPFVFNLSRPDRYYPLNTVIRWFIQFFKVNPLIAAYKAGKVKAKELLLFCPAALNLAKKDPRFILEQHDLLKPFKEQSHIIRAMNVLNTTYFSKPEFEKVITYIHDGLLANGLFITGSNQDAGSLVHGGVYQKTTQGFEKLWQSGEGSPIDEMIMDFSKTSH